MFEICKTQILHHDFFKEAVITRVHLKVRYVEIKGISGMTIHDYFTDRGYCKKDDVHADAVNNLLQLQEKALTRKISRYLKIMLLLQWCSK